MADNSCYDCKKRYPGCHSRCSEYKAFRETLLKRKGKYDTEYEQYTDSLLKKRGQAMQR